MIQLPSKWRDSGPREVIEELLHLASATGEYLPVATGLTFAYLRHCVEPTLIEEQSARAVDRGRIFRVRNFQWRVLAGAADADLDWAVQSVDPTLDTSIVATPWTFGIMNAAFRSFSASAHGSVTTLKSLISLRLFFVSGGDRRVEIENLSQMLDCHNAYCMSRGTSGAVIAA